MPLPSFSKEKKKKKKKAQFWLQFWLSVVGFRDLLNVAFIKFD